jgi:hypothetical protein
MAESDTELRQQINNLGHCGRKIRMGGFKTLGRISQISDNSVVRRTASFGSCENRVNVAPKIAQEFTINRSQ